MIWLWVFLIAGITSALLGLFFAVRVIAYGAQGVAIGVWPLLAIVLAAGGLLAFASVMLAYVIPLVFS